MLLSSEKINENTYRLRMSFEGSEYETALSDYPKYIHQYQDTYENDLFPRGKTPTIVNEEQHGDDLYRAILKGNFSWLYHSAVAEAQINNPHLEKVEIEFFSSERTVFCMLVQSLEQAYAEDPDSVLNEEYSRISNVSKLVVKCVEKRDHYFWKYLQDMCTILQQNLSDDVLPMLDRIGVIRYRQNSVVLDPQDPDPIRSMLPLLELQIFPCAVFAAALHEYINTLSEEDTLNLDKYIFAKTKQILVQFDEDSQRVLFDRFLEYAHACKANLISGYSLYGVIGEDIDSIKNWSRKHEVKCANLLCDHIAYFHHFKEPGTYDDLESLAPIVVNNSESTIANYTQLCTHLYTTASLIYMTVRGILNGSSRLQWRAEGLCQHCGREFKRGLLGLKCPSCKVKKDY